MTCGGRAKCSLRRGLCFWAPRMQSWLVGEDPGLIPSRVHRASLSCLSRAIWVENKIPKWLSLLMRNPNAGYARTGISWSKDPTHAEWTGPQIGHSFSNLNMVTWRCMGPLSEFWHGLFIVSCTTWLHFGIIVGNMVLRSKYPAEHLESYRTCS